MQSQVARFSSIPMLVMITTLAPSTIVAPVPLVCAQGHKSHAMTTMAVPMISATPLRVIASMSTTQLVAAMVMLVPMVIIVLVVVVNQVSLPGCVMTATHAQMTLATLQLAVSTPRMITTLVMTDPCAPLVIIAQMGLVWEQQSLVLILTITTALLQPVVL